MFRRKRERDLDRELRSHLDLEAEESGDPNKALRALGNTALIKEDTRAAWGWMWLDRLWQDLRYAARMLRKNPGFTTVAVLSLTLAIGANTALFSVLDAVLWKSLPVRDPRELRILTWERSSASWAPVGTHSGYNYSWNGIKFDGSFSYPAYQAFLGLPQISDLMAFFPSQFNVSAGGTTDAADGQFVSGNYFQGLGVRPLAGRVLLPEDDARERAGAVVLAYQYWERRFGLDPQIIGREIAVNRSQMTVVGVLPPEFQGLYPGNAVDLFVPLSLIRVIPPSWLSPLAQDHWWLQIFARLRPGVPDSAATEAVASTLAHQIESYAGSPAAGSHYPRVVLQPGTRGAPVFYPRGPNLNDMYLLAAVAGVVLLMACANLANLLLARGAARTRELAARLSLGASRARLMRQLLTESLILALFGGGLGWILARPILTIVVRLILGPLPSTLDVRLDARTLVFTMLAATLTCLLASVYPAWRGTKVDLSLSLKEGSRAGGGSHVWGGGTLVSVQVALSVLMLVGAGLFVRTLQRLLAVDLGYRTERILTFQTDASKAGFAPERLAGLYERLRQDIAALPGVASVGMSEEGLLRGYFSNDNVYIPGQKAGIRPNAYILRCSTSFLSTMQISVLGGRDLSPTDAADAPLVAVVNEAFVKRFLGGQGPIGRSLYFGAFDRPAPDARAIQIVGVAKDSHYTGVRADVPPTVYTPYLQSKEHYGGMTFAIRTALPPLSIAAAVRRVVAETDSNLPVSGLATMDELVSRSTGTERAFAELVSLCGLLETLLAAIGLYGVLAFTVVRRTPEIGIRMALGATHGRVQWLVLRQSLVMVAIGLAAGVPLALLLTRYIRTMLYGVAPNDPWSFAAAILLMGAVGAGASWIPARRASKVDPMVALRSE
jgi:predicted permease